MTHFTRITYSYLDFEKGLLQSYIDCDLKKDSTNEIIHLLPSELQAIVAKKWRNLRYKGGDIHSVEQLYVD